MTHALPSPAPIGPGGPEHGTNRSQKIWPVAVHTGQGRSHGTSNLAAFDRWFRYPAGFAPDYAEHLLARLGLDPGQVVVDCFAGSGVTGTASRTVGLGFVGIEAHPMVAELARIKLNALPNTSALRDAARKVADAANTCPKTPGPDHPAPLPSGPPVDMLPGPGEAQQPDLITRSFSPPVLATLNALREAIKEHPDDAVRPYLKWALLSTLRDVAQVKVGWPYQRPAVPRRPRHSEVAARFQERISWMSDDIEATTADGLERRVITGDSRSADAWHLATDGKQLDGCVSSPPYLNNFDYADATRLEAYFWGEVTTWGEMSAHIRADMLTATTQQSSTAEGNAALRLLAASSIGDEIQRIVALLTEQRRARPRGKEYDRVVPAYFAAMSAILANLSDHLAPGAPVLWLVGDSAPYGVYVDTPDLIGRLARDHGLSVEADVILRRRGNRWTTARDRHNVSLSERLLVMRREAP